MCSYSWTLESREPKPVSRVVFMVVSGGGWHQLSVMPGAVGPQSIQAGNFHFSSEAADVNVPQRAVTAPVPPHLTCTTLSLHCSELQSAIPRRSQADSRQAMHSSNTILCIRQTSTDLCDEMANRSAPLIPSLNLLTPNS